MATWAIAACIILVAGATNCVGRILPHADAPFYQEGLNLGNAPRSMSLLQWQQAAQANLSAWNRNLFLNTMHALKNHHREQYDKVNQKYTSNSQTEQREAAVRAVASSQPENNGRYAVFQLLNPIITCPPGRPLGMLGGHLVEGGKQDGHKWACGLETLKPPCTVLSIGSNMDTTFEQAVLDKTKCTVLTMDCTVKEPITLSNRHKFLKKCLGSTAKAATDANFMDLSQVVEAAGGGRIDYLKIDIEGHEWDVLGALGTENTVNWADLPTQIAMELHVGHVYMKGIRHSEKEWSTLVWPPHRLAFMDVQMFMSHLASLGYGIVSRDDNPFCYHCTELLWHRTSSGAPYTT